MLPEIIKNKLEEILRAEHAGFRIFSSSPLGGGDINRAARLETSVGNLFIKWNRADLYPGMFDKEAKGLNLLNAANVIQIPEVLLSGLAGNHAFLCLEFIESGSPGTDFWKNFGRSLAKLHQDSNDFFGLDHDNYIGSLPQANKNYSCWIDFFIEQRINFQLELARNSGLIDRGVIKAAERMFGRLNEIIPVEQPSLLHGDLWSGNFMVSNRGEACLIDPAVYYGHREMDIAMTRLFDGFSAAFYEYYNEEYPMEKGWENRLEIFNLYPLLVHVNLFGRAYVSQVSSILRKF